MLEEVGDNALWVDRIDTLRIEERAASFRFSTFLLKLNGRLHQIVWQGAITIT